jgi:predicted RNA-binding protein with PUA-like domain
MALWLFKQEPTCYSFADLQREGQTVWDGVRNPMARKYLRKVKRGDKVLFYHTGKDKAVVGVMQAVANARAVPTGQDPSAVIVEVKPVRMLERPVTLAEIKKDSILAKWDLVRLPRLSVMPATAAQWRRIEKLASGRG